MFAVALTIYYRRFGGRFADYWAVTNTAKARFATRGPSTGEAPA
jgi:hypothetical protein